MNCFSGTFRLIDGAKKSGTKFDDAFENALIAMNEPKDLSVSKLRDYLGRLLVLFNTWVGHSYYYLGRSLVLLPR